MLTIIILLMIILVAAQSSAQDAFVPTAAERAKISYCIKRAASETKLKQMSA